MFAIAANSADTITPTTDKITPTDAYLDEVLGKNSIKFKKALLKKIEKLGLELHDFSERDAVTVDPLLFPPPVTAKRGFTQLPANNRTYAWFDPTKALEILSNHNDKNRPIDPRKVMEWAIAMLTGQYLEDNPDGIYFSPDKILLNGQHRLVALIISEAVSPAIKMAFPIEFNKPKELMPLIDIVRVRNLGDKAVMQMKEEGVTFSKNGRYKGIRVDNLSKIANSILNDNTLSSIDRINFLSEHRDLLLDFYQVLKTIPIIRYNASWAAAFAKAALPEFFGSDTILPLAERFANQTFTGPKDPLRVLFTRFNKVKEGKEKLKPRERYGLTVKAIRKALLEEKVSNLHTTSVDWTKEEAKSYKVQGKNSGILKKMSRKNR